ncbi:tetratricopeptide repeat protein [uncultured Methanobrevibacter sp.]|uniref:tetratricopeptide repeat protein n=1 Tax=uncultured Methanobrevibacter sp. TaxID=253161 RepID=UPI0026184816|nr:tetratricopeptide repeat protein [uncultured Methanobrevibacter sp.]
MDSKINRGRMEFSDENYEKALLYFDAVDESDEDYDFVLIFKITCLMELERYDKALFLIDSLLGEEPDNELLMYEKIRCHIALSEKVEALDTLKKFEKIMASDDKRMMLDAARFYKILGDFKNALRFCNMALEVDENFEDALYEKSLIGLSLNNDDIINNCADKLLLITGGDKYRILPVFYLKLYSGKFRDCVEIVDELGSEIKDETRIMIQSVIYSQLCESLGVNIHLVDGEDIGIGDAIELLLDYKENGTDHGIVNDIGFIIM